MARKKKYTKTILKKIYKSLQNLNKSVQKKRLIYDCNQKIKNLQDGTETLSGQNEKEIREFFKPYCKISTEWHKWYSSKNDVFDVRYIPEDKFYTDIEPCLNNLDFSKALEDKNLYDLIFHDESVALPETIIRKINGYLCDGNFNPVDIKQASAICLQEQEVVIKKSIGSGGGHGVEIIGRDALAGHFEEMISSFDENFVVQKVIKQHPNLSKIHCNSVNTIKILSILWNNEIRILSSVLRMGIDGKRVDNQSSGGISVGIDKNGRLNNYAYTMKGERYTKHPNTQFVFEGSDVPFYTQIAENAEKLHKRFAHFALISWDFAVDENGPILIEYNLSSQEINFHQLNNGALFGELTEKVLAKCYSNK